MNPTNLLRIITTLCIIAIALVVLTYYLNFKKWNISESTLEWGTFGDFFGGILNPIIGIINIYILIYITYAISSAEERSNQNELEIQKKIKLYSIKHNSLKNLNKILEKVQPELIKSEKDSQLKLILIRNELNAFITTNSYLFPSFDSGKPWKQLRESIEKLSDISGRHFKNNHSEDPEKEILPELSIFNELKIEFIIDVQSQILT